MHSLRLRHVLTALLVCSCVARPCLAAHWHLPFHLRRWLRRERWIELKDHSPRPRPSADDKRDGVILFVRSPLERMYANSRPRPQDLPSEVDLTAARDEYEPAQVGVYAVRDLDAVALTISDLHDEAGAVLPASAASVRMVRFYGAQLSFRHRDRFGVVPKTLEVAAPIAVPRGTVRPYWITFHVPDDQPGGVYRGAIHVGHSQGGRDLPLAVQVLPLRLREPDILYGTLSINPLARISHALAHSHALLRGTTIEEDIHLAGADALLAQADVMLRDQRAHGMNTISPWSAKDHTDSGGHPYLRDLEVAMRLYRRIGFSKPMLYQMGTLLHTNKKSRDGSYRAFDPVRDTALASAIARYYTMRFAREGLPGIIFLPVEEPNAGDGIALFDPPDIRQGIARDVLRAIRDAGGRTALTCTPESAAAVGALAEYWIVAHRSFTPAIYAQARASGAKLALYANATMMGQGTYLPRFLFGYFVWANGLKGMLPWTYPMQPNRFPTNVGNRGEGGLDVRDGFLGADGTPIPTIQWELSREGIDDAKYLATIEAFADEARRSARPEQRAAAADAATFLDAVRARVQPDVHRYEFEDPHTGEPRPEPGWDAASFSATRARAVAVLQELLAAR